MALDEKRRQKKLAKKAAKRKSVLAAQRQQAATRKSKKLQYISYEITDEPLEETAYARLPEAVQEQVNTIYTDVLRQKPKEAAAELQSLIEQYPDVPQLHNHLHAAYALMGEKAQAKQVLQQTQTRFPDYLFGRISHALDCLQRGDVDEVAEIFDNKFELKLLYPEREVFHITEILGFYMVMARYFHAQGKDDRAETYYQLLLQLDPEHEHTRAIGRLLHPPRFDRLLRSVLDKHR